MATTIKLEGFSELERSLDDLTKAAGKGALRRAMITAAEPMARAMRSMAPRGEDLHLSEGIGVGTRLTKRQATLHREMFQDNRAAIEVFVGAKADPAAHNQEFGNMNHDPQPFARPAFDQEVRPTLDRLKVELWDEISKAIARAERKAARLAAKE